MKRDKTKSKGIKLVYGYLLSPLAIGRSAVVVHAGSAMFTSPVRAIKRQTKAHVWFETENSAYCVVPYLPPEAFQAPARLVVA